jgi:Cys/Met metabolism PLP-dependent enzyme
VLFQPRILQVLRVHYPGLESHSEYHIAKRQMTGFGGVISFEVCFVFLYLKLVFVKEKPRRLIIVFTFFQAIWENEK